MNTFFISLALKYTGLSWNDLLPVYEFVTSGTGLLENVDSLSYAESPNVDALHYAVSKIAFINIITDIINKVLE